MTLFKPELPSSNENKKVSTATDLQGTYENVIKELRTLFTTVETMGKAPNALNKINQIFVEIGLKRSEHLVAANASSPSTGSMFQRQQVYKNQVAGMKNETVIDSGNKPEDVVHKSFNAS